MLLAVIFLLWFVGVLVYHLVCWIDKITSINVEPILEKQRKEKEKAQAEFDSSPEHMMEIVEVAMRYKTGRTTKVPYPKNEDELRKLRLMYNEASKMFDVK